MHAAPPRFAPPSASLLTWEWVLDHLAGCRNAWLSTVRPDGRPHAAPLWIVIAGGRLWFSTPRTTTKAKNLRADGRIALHVDSGDVVTIIEGQALPGRADDDVLAAYSDKYGEAAPGPDSFWVVEIESALAWRGHLGSEQVQATRFTPA